MSNTETSINNYDIHFICKRILI